MIDPVRTLTARSANQHIQPSGHGRSPGSVYDVCYGHEGLHRADWLEEHTIGWEHLLERVLQFPPERAAQIYGLAAETIIDLARTYATTSPALLRLSDGINRHTNGGQTVRTLACLPAVTGQYGLRGGGLCIVPATGCAGIKRL